MAHCLTEMTLPFEENFPTDFSVVWTRGKGCVELANLLADGRPNRVEGDLIVRAIEHRADLLVAKKVPSDFDLVSVAVPIDFQPEKVTKVVATVSGGPHSALAAEVAARLAHALDVPAEMISARVPDTDSTPADEILERIGLTVPGITGRVVEVEGMAELVEDLDEGALLVLGAPGGSWLQRAMFGPGARLRRTAQAGAVVVRGAPDRVFHHMGEPVYVGPLREAADTLRFHTERTLAVAEDGRLVGLVRRDRLLGAGSDPVGTVMEDAISVRVDETMSEAWVLEPEFGGDPIPVTDHDENLVGGLSLPVV